MKRIGRPAVRHLRIFGSVCGPGCINGHSEYVYSNQADTLNSPYQDTLSNDIRCFGATSC
jgi:hypothetical protein